MPHNRYEDLTTRHFAKAQAVWKQPILSLEGKIKTMGVTGKTAQKALLNRAKDLQETEPGFASFLHLTITSTDPEDLVGISTDGMETLLRHSFAKLATHQPNEHLIHIWNPELGETETPAVVIDIFVADMPFLVDSVLAAIRAMGGTIRLMSHPVLHLDMTVSPPKILDATTQDSQRESCLHIHIDPIADEERLAELYAELDAVLTEVRHTVIGWRPMLERLRELVHTYRHNPPKIAAPVLAEMMHFLAWLADHNFTFLGMREYQLKGTGDDAVLEPIKGSGLGILVDEELFFLRSGADYVEMTEQHVAFLRTNDPLMVTKANVRGRVHRRTHMDYVGVKLYADDGTLTGELRILGHFTSMSLTTPYNEVPLVRRKISEVMAKSGFDPQGHAGKALMAALDGYPREELFQIDEDELFEFASLIAALADRPKVRVLPRIDRFDNFVSILLYMPREDYTSDVRAQIGEHLAKRYDGRVSVYYPHFPEGELVRVHFIIGRNGGTTPRPERVELETEIADIARRFGDKLMEAAENPSAIIDYCDAFSQAYQSHNSHIEALDDIAVFQKLEGDEKIAARLSTTIDADGQQTLKVYHNSSPIPLSDRVPMLENFGFRVIDESTYSVCPSGGTEQFLHHMKLVVADGSPINLEVVAPLLENALLAVWEQRAESDGFNKLAAKAEMAWDDIAIIRALGRYLKQIGLTFSQRYMWTALSAHPDTANHLVALFHTKHDPGFKGDRAAISDELETAILAALTEISSADEDLIIRHFLNLVQVSLRTNFYQRDDDGARRPALAIKFDSANVDGMPEPRPYREIFVYSPMVEGVHLRGGEIARGGLRWSDRPEDFRTEVLGLVKAQMVKNAVIVPLGAKGGFVPKTMPANPDRDTFMALGTACYKIFISTLLDVTDNLDGDAIVPPQEVTRHDGDDPYLVVAADKGTASFSDTANAISEDRGFWLGDAFASGGSAGYDHKKMGITARGGWEAVKRHFRELDRDIQTTPFTAVGVGDMSGDVFGNGMLLSKQTRLIAAFDHRDIFIDPDPDLTSSFNERKRLFKAGRSSWQDYNPVLLSKGGGIYPRNSKTVDLTPEARDVLGLGDDALTPNDVMQAILKAEVDLLWFGGIGTYVRASSESDTEAGDRANDPIRITGKQVRAKAIGEGANLGITHLGRIEYANAGGRINTDAIDNSAGVNSSDLEVNIKIALGGLVRAGKLDIEDRNKFLVEMTDEVAELCLRNNYLQTLALSLVERDGMAEFPDLVTFMQELELKGALDRSIEYLPDDVALAERAAVHQPFVRPELSVLLAYAKNTLYADLLASKVPDDAYLARELYRYFPEQLNTNYPETIENHRLRREVIATVLANAMINRGGPAFVHVMTDATSATAAEVAFAYAAARDSYGLVELNAQIDALDNKIKGETQLELYNGVKTLLINQTLWFLRNASFEDGLSGSVEKYRTGIDEIKSALGSILPTYVAKSVADKAVAFVNGGAPRGLARSVAELSALTLASDIVLVAENNQASVKDAAEAYFKVFESFRLGRITERSGSINLADRYDRMALDRALANLMRAQRALTGSVLAAGKGTVAKRFETWRSEHEEETGRIMATVTALTEEELTVSRLSVAAGLLSDLIRH